jgi:hypothetical protein
MPRGINLVPMTADPIGFPANVGENFRRVVDSIANINDTRQGVALVNGTLTLPTGLTRVLYAMVSLRDDPVINACIVKAAPTTGGSLQIKVFGLGAGPSIVASTTAINVTWIAYGF